MDNDDDTVECPPVDENDDLTVADEVEAETTVEFDTDEPLSAAAVATDNNAVNVRNDDESAAAHATQEAVAAVEEMEQSPPRLIITKMVSFIFLS